MLLDFEKPIAELESKLQDMKHLASGSDKEVQGAVKALEKKILELKKETFENLTGWQRVQLSILCRGGETVPRASCRGS